MPFFIMIFVAWGLWSCDSSGERPKLAIEADSSATQSQNSTQSKPREPSTIKKAEDSGAKGSVDANPPGEMPAAPLVLSRIGINWEDTRAAGDSDFNDVIVCLNGKFTIEPTQFTSAEAQNISISVAKNGTCTHNLRVIITSKDKAPGEAIVPSDSPVPLEVNSISQGDTLRFEMIPTVGCEPGVVRSMTDTAAAKIKPDVCGTSL